MEVSVWVLFYDQHVLITRKHYLFDVYSFAVLTECKTILLPKKARTDRWMTIISINYADISMNGLKDVRFGLR